MLAITYIFRNDQPLRPILKKGSAHMDKIIAACGILGAIAVIIVVKILDLNAFVSAVLIIAAVLVAIICMAKAGSKGRKSEGTGGK